jgi:hypothetical protein
MFIKSQIETKLDAEILSLLAKLKETTKDSEEYVNLVDRISKLHKLKTEERSKPLSLDTVLIVSANIFGILWLARYERENVIKAPKAFSSVIKPPR